MLLRSSASRIAALIRSPVGETGIVAAIVLLCWLMIVSGWLAPVPAAVAQDTGGMEQATDGTLQETELTPEEIEAATPRRVTTERERAETDVKREAARYAQWTVTKLEVSGLPQDVPGGIEQKLSLGVRSGFLRLKRPPLNPANLTADRRRIVLYLARNGYPFATTGVRFVPDARAENVVVLIDVDPGPIVRFGEFHIDGLPAALATERKRAIAPLHTAAPFSDAAIGEAREALEIVLLQGGYAQSKVDVTLEMTAADRADVTFVIVPGERFSITSVSVDGAPPDLQRLAARSAYVKPGTPYSPKVVRQARDSLRWLDLFRQVRIGTRQTGPTTMDLHAEVTPRKFRSVEASIGTWRDNPIIVRGLWIHRNLFKQGRGLFVGGEYGRHDQRVEARVWWSALVRVRSRAEFGYVYKIEDEASYWLRSNEIHLSNLFHTLGSVSWRVGIAYSDNDLDQRTTDEDAFLQQDGRQLILTGRWFRETVDNPLDPRNGSRVTLTGAFAPPNGLTDSPFSALEGVWAPVWPVGMHTRVAARLDLGYSWPMGDAVDVLPNRRFFAGGFNTHRGYTRRRLGPYDSADNPIGGELMALASSELRFPIKGMVGGDIFVDTGQVWRKPDEFDLSDIAVAIGAGVMLATPIGPIRFDVGYNLTEPPPGNSRTVFQFGVGHPY